MSSLLSIESVRAEYRAAPKPARIPAEGRQ